MTIFIDPDFSLINAPCFCTRGPLSRQDFSVEATTGSFTQRQVLRQGHTPATRTRRASGMVTRRPAVLIGPVFFPINALCFIARGVPSRRDYLKRATAGHFKLAAPSKLQYVFHLAAC